MFRIYALCGFLVLSLLQSCQGKTVTPAQSKIEQALTIVQEEKGDIQMPPIPTIFNKGRRPAKEKSRRATDAFLR